MIPDKKILQTLKEKDYVIEIGINQYDEYFGRIYKDNGKNLDILFSRRFKEKFFDEKSVLQYMKTLL